MLRFAAAAAEFWCLLVCAGGRWAAGFLVSIGLTTMAFSALGWCLHVQGRQSLKNIAAQAKENSLGGDAEGEGEALGLIDNKDDGQAQAHEAQGAHSALGFASSSSDGGGGSSNSNTDSDSGSDSESASDDNAARRPSPSSREYAVNSTKGSAERQF